MWWIETYVVLTELVDELQPKLLCECIGQGDWVKCDNHPDDFTFACMAEQIWAEKEKLA